jgi:hypothetical protein
LSNLLVASSSLGLLLARDDREAKQKQSDKQTHLFPISAAKLFATLLSGELAIRWA